MPKKPRAQDATPAMARRSARQLARDHEYIAALGILRANGSRMDEGTLARHVSSLQKRNIQAAEVVELYARKGHGSAFRERRKRGRELLMSAMVAGTFDGKGSFLDRFGSEPIPLTGRFLNYLVNDSRNFPLRRLLNSCWLTRSAARAWLREVSGSPTGKKPGPTPATRDRVAQEMLKRLQAGTLAPETLEGEKGEVLAAEYHVGRATANAARKKALSEFRTPTNIDTE